MTFKHHASIWFSIEPSPSLLDLPALRRLHLQEREDGRLEIVKPPQLIDPILWKQLAVAVMSIMILSWFLDNPRLIKYMTPLMLLGTGILGAAAVWSSLQVIRHLISSDSIILDEHVMIFRQDRLFAGSQRSIAWEDVQGFGSEDVYFFRQQVYNIDVPFVQGPEGPLYLFDRLTEAEGRWVLSLLASWKHELATA